MKKIVGFICLLTVMVSIMSCSDDDDVAQLYEVKVVVNYPDGYGETQAKGITVKVNGVQNSKTETSTTNNSGAAVFHLEAGSYNFTATGESEEFVFNANLEGENIIEATELELTLKAASVEGGLVFKEIYYTGSSTPEGGRYYADQFHEIYNNSDEIIYLDGMCIGVLQQTSSKENIWLDDSGNILPRLPLQFYVWYVPGNGKEHPLAPRTSCIIAQDGIDHQTDPNGNASSPVNLGNADWETYCGDINGGKDADAAGVPNLSMMFTTTTSMYDWLHSVMGAAVVIFKLPEGTNPVEWAEDPNNLATKPGSTSTKNYLMVPKDYVIDAVEIVRVEEEKRHKRLPEELDAGKIWCDGTYISKSIRRKVKQIIDGKVIYKDTNNSTEDFLGNQNPTPGIQPTVVDE